MTLQLLGPDGVLRDQLVFSTAQTTSFLSGTLSTDIIDVEVSIFGQPFTSDPSLVAFTGTSFTIPNPSSFPNGLDLLSGDNIIQVRGVYLGGTRTPAVTATIRLISPSQVEIFEPPSGITIERMDNEVTITVQGLTDTRVTGYNFYASTTAGGGASGYTRLNVNKVVTGEPVENATELFTLTSKNPAQASNPLYVRARVDQENLAETVLSADVDSRVEIAQTVTEIQTQVTLSSLETVTYYSFAHGRNNNAQSPPPTIFSGVFASTPSTESLFYVVTAVYFDTTTQTEFESFFSTEVVGAPAVIRIQTTTLAAISRQQTLEEAIFSIYRQNPDIAVQPGAVVRDTFLDPFSTEVERVRFLLDYVYRASSFDTLLAIDDPNGTGASVSPASSAYKTALASALFFSNVNDVQAIIDGSFEKLAANFGVTREGGKGAIGEGRFYTSLTPTQSLPIPLGTIVVGGGIQYRTTRSSSIPVSSLASFYNPATRQYSVTVPLQAVTVGSVTNLGARQITSSAVYGLSVTNDAPTFGGTDVETNSHLASRARAALASVDTGTAQGYGKIAASVPGVLQSQVVRAGSPFMQRDYDTTLKRHMGGLVDVWERGVRNATISDVFAFTYSQKRDIQFVVIGTPSDYVLRAIDVDLTVSNPLAQMLDYLSLGLGIRNITTGEFFDLTGVVILNYNTIQLSTASGIVQPALGLTDIVLGDYRYRTGTTYTGEVTGLLDTQLYSLVHPKAPLGLGKSTQAGDYLQINESTDPNVVSPSGALFTETNELHLVSGFYVESLFRLGADSLSLVGTNSTSTVTYAGPYDPGGTPDYTIVEGDATNPVGIRRTQTSTIPDGGTVLITYQYAENFVVSYQTNLVTSALQQALDDGSHATALVLAKESVQVPVDITASVVLKKGTGTQQGDIRNLADQSIRNNLQYLVSGSVQALRRSDVITAIDRSDYVSYVVVPLTKMARAVNSQVVRDDLDTLALGDAFRVDSWSNSQYATWLIIQQLTAPTDNGGGPTNEFRGVYQDDVALDLQTSAPQNLAQGNGRAYIIGSGGLLVPGYSQDLVKNHVLVSLPIGDAPSNHKYWTTYMVRYSEGEQDIAVNQMEYLVLGSVRFTYTEDR